MNTIKDLKRAMQITASRIKAEGRYAEGSELGMTNDRAVYVFSQQGAVRRHMDGDGQLVNVTGISLVRTCRLMRQEGVDWPTLDWQALLDWFYEHWDEVVRFLISILAMVLI